MTNWVRCINCGWIGILPIEKEKCPNCKKIGWLALWYKLKRRK